MTITSTNKIEAFFADAIYQYNQYLEEYLHQLKFPDNLLLEAVQYVLMTPSKKFRANLVYATGAIYNLDQKILNPIALAIEMIHAYSLVHDDLPAMDNDDWRRGQPSCHKAFDEATAILTGNTLHHLAFSLLLDVLPQYLPSNDTIDIVQTIIKYIGPSGILSGQSMDLQLLNQPGLTQQKLTEIHHLKTSTLLHAVVESVWIAGNGTNDDKQKLNQFAMHLGLAYQMLDDYGDMYVTESWGKNQSSDAINQKTTYVNFYNQFELKLAIKAQFNEATHSIQHFCNHVYLNHLLIQLVTKINSI